MTNHRRSHAIALLALCGMLAACSKSEPPATTSSEPSSIAPSSAAVADTAVTTSPTSTIAFEDPAATPAPMLPMLGSSPPQASESKPATADARRIGPEEAATLVQTGDAILVDVRNREAFVIEHIQGAKHIPWEEVEKRAAIELAPTRWIIPYCT